MDSAELADLGQQLRVDGIRASAAAGSGHPTSSMSAADLMAVLLAHHLHYDFDRPAHPANDRFVLSKGHASPLLYAAYKAAGAIDDDELLTFRTLGSRLEGHPTPRRLPWVETATGSLGQGLPVGVGIALSGKRLESSAYRVRVLCGDSELAEGSVREAAEHASYENFDNLTAIVDVNRLGQRGPTRHGHDLDAHARRFRAFGWHTIEIDGHDVDAIDRASGEARSTLGQPSVILARTLKGKGVADVEDRERLHGKPLENADDAFEELGGVRDLRVRVHTPDVDRVLHSVPGGPLHLPRCEQGEKAATRDAFGKAPAALGTARGDVVALDGEVGDSTGSHAGVAIGRDGPSQMGLEDLAMMRSVHGSTVLYPCDAHQTARLVATMAGLDGVRYLRTSRGEGPVIYGPDEEFPVGGSKMLRSSGRDDRLTIVAAGVTVPEALAAADALDAQGVPVRVIDLYSVKPVDRDTLRRAAEETGCLLTVEDHRPEGGLGDAVLDAFADGRPVPRLVRLAVTTMPGSASPQEQLHAAGIDAESIAAAVRLLVEQAITP
ncbi:transketolase family protein [Streptomyces longwoodensis]|uniref:transketolase family protein n=1 Tax=Streptomyces longwoodensis TaxID=68231 RepID=UPI0037FBFB86